MNTTFDKNDEKEKVFNDSQLSLIEHQSPPPNFVTQRATKGEGSKPKSVESEDSIKVLMEMWFSKQDLKLSKQDEKLTKILKDQEDIKESISFVYSRIDAFSKKLEDTEKRVQLLEDRVDRKDAMIAQLENKIDLMDQQARICNVEISNLPEKRNENIVSIIESICSTIQFPLQPTDIISIHRVPHADSKNSRPKNIILKLRSKVLRDNFLTSARRAKDFTSQSLNMAGPTAKIYFGEHLTLRNKLIFREARMAAKKNGYRYVWPKNGTVLVRADDASPVFAVRSTQEVATKVKPK